MFRRQGRDSSTRNKHDDKISECVLANDAAKLKQLLDKKKFSSLLSVDPNGRVPIYEASRLGYAEIVQLLIASEPDASPADEEGRTALHMAAINGHADCISALLSKGVPKDTVDGKRQSALHLAAMTGQLDAVSVLIANQCDTEVRDKDGNTPLMSACKANQHQTAIALMNASANVNAYNRQQKNALMFACEHGASNVVQMLLARGADAAKKDTGGKTARSYAENHPQVLSILPASAPMGRSTSGNLSSGTEQLTPETLRKMELAKKYPPAEKKDENKELIKGLKDKIAGLKKELDAEKAAHQLSKDDINVLKIQLAAFADDGGKTNGAAGGGDDDDDDVNFDSDDDLDMGEDKAEAEQKKKVDEQKKQDAEKQVALLSAKLASLEIANKDLEQAKADAENRDLDAAAQEEISALKGQMAEMQDRLETMGGGIPMVPLTVVQSLKENSKKEIDALKAQLAGGATASSAGGGGGEDIAALKQEHQDQILRYRSHLILAFQGKLSDPVAKGLELLAAMEGSDA